MRLALRYSLTFLLLATAVVAGGIRYWQGPHTAAVALDAEPVAGELLHWWGPLTEGATVRYRYVNTPAGRQRGPAIVTGGDYALEVLPPQLGETNHPPADARRVIPTLRSTLARESPERVNASEWVTAVVTTLAAPLGNQGDRAPVYLVSDAGGIYRLIEVASYYMLRVEPTAASAIGDAELRAAVESALP